MISSENKINLDLEGLHLVIEAWRGRTLFVSEFGAGYTDAWIDKIEEIVYDEDAEAFEFEHGYVSDMLLMFYFDCRKVFGWSRTLEHAELAPIRQQGRSARWVCRSRTSA